MAKQSLPSVDAIEPPTITQIGAEYPADEFTDKPTRDMGYQDQLICYDSVHLKLRKQCHRIAFRDQLQKLVNSGARLADGKAVFTKTDVLIWMLENPRP